MTTDSYEVTVVVEMPDLTFHIITRRVSYKELKKGLRRLRFNASARSLMAHLDVDQNGKVSVDEWMNRFREEETRRLDEGAPAPRSPSCAVLCCMWCSDTCCEFLSEVRYNKRVNKHRGSLLDKLAQKAKRDMA